MFVPEGFYVIHQPKHHTPGVFDLHPRGMFKTRPFVTSDWGIRILVNDKQQLKLQYLVLTDEPGADPATGEKYNVLLKSILVDLDPDQGLEAKELDPHVAREADRTQIEKLVGEWRSAYIPGADADKIDVEALRAKLTASANEYEAARFKRLALKNNGWVAPALPRAVQDFRRYLHPLVRNDLHRCYAEMDGREDEAGLIQKIALLQCVYTEDSDDPLLKPNGAAWKDEDEVWECWNGFAGSTEEARRIGRALESVFRPVIKEINSAVTV